MWLKITDFHDVDDFKVTVDQYEISFDDVRGIEIHWNINEIYTLGYITWIDSIKMIEHKPVRPGEFIEMYWQDGQKETFKQTFVITDIEEIRTEKEQTIGTIRFIDKNSFNFLKTFHSKGFDNGDMKEIVDFFINKYKQDKEVENKLSEKKWGNEEDADKMTHIIPQDRPLLNSLYKLMLDGDFMIYQTRDKLIVCDWKDITSKGPLDHKLVLQPDNINYIGKIGDIKSKLAEAIATNIIMPDTTTLKIKHYEGKKLIQKDLDYKKAIEESGKLGATDIKWVEGNGTKALSYSTNTSEAFMNSFKKYVNEALCLEVVVPGWNKRNIGEVLDIMLETGDINVDIDKNMSGKWLIIGIVDKISQGYFVQKITLARSVQK